MAIVLDGTANTVTPLNGALGATTPSTVAATTVVASSTIKGATTIAVGNATPSASGAGITFPATQSASTDANTLDDYEEGTWTPSLGGNTTYSIQDGTYTKIGNIVHLDFHIYVTSIGTGSTWQITGIPFTGSTDGAGSMGYYTQLANSFVQICIFIDRGGATSINLYNATAAATGLGATAVFKNSAYLKASITYRV